jgi:hypothetical protein
LSPENIKYLLSGDAKSNETGLAPQQSVPKVQQPSSVTQQPSSTAQQPSPAVQPAGTQQSAGAGNASQGGLTLDGWNRKRITEQDLTSLSREEVQLLRNVFYAYHGRQFTTKWIQEEFGRQSWYKINPRFKESDLTELEKDNINVILNYEKKMGWR